MHGCCGMTLLVTRAGAGSVAAFVLAKLWARVQMQSACSIIAGGIEPCAREPSMACTCLQACCMKLLSTFDCLYAGAALGRVWHASTCTYAAVRA